MKNFTHSLNYADTFAWMAIIFSLVFPLICLDYIFSEPKLGQFTVPYGQYIFFITTLLAAGTLVFRLERNALLNILFNKMIWIFSGLFLVGFLMSSPSIWGIRLLSIIVLSSLAIIIVATFIQQNSHKFQQIICFLLLLPFAFPVFMAFFLELTGPIELGILFENSKHMKYSPHRWNFLHSAANGFGFSASFVTVSLYIAFFKSSKKLLKIFYITASLIACYVLIASGTRAAYIFALASIFAFHLFYFGARPFFLILVGFFFVCIVSIIMLGLDDISSYLRVHGSDLNRISSKRWQGIIGMWEIFSNSPISGIGFGAADNNFPIYPSNIFYIALPVEIGIFGLIGALGGLGLPAFFILRQIIVQKRFAVLNAKSYLCVLSVCVLAGFVPYLMFEFNILRVSGVNQLFFFCWGMAMLEFSQQNRS